MLQEELQKYTANIVYKQDNQLLLAYHTEYKWSNLKQPA